MKTEEISTLNLAFLGDAVYSLLVRKSLTDQADYRVKTMAETASKLVSAHTQAALVREMNEQDILTIEEADVLRRGRNAHPRTTAKHADIADYRQATGLETLFGWLYHRGQRDRLEQIWNFIETTKEYAYVTMDLRKERGSFSDSIR